MATTIFLVNPFVSATPPPTYLLDTYSAEVAYSLRQLKTGVTSVIRVRRSSDNAEQDFTETEITDGTLTTFTGANDGFVTTWYDQSGNGNDATQTTATNQPQIVSSGSVLTNSNGNAKVYQVNYAKKLLLNSTIAEVSQYTVCGVYERTADNVREHFGMFDSSGNYVTLQIGTGDAHIYNMGTSKTFSTENISGSYLGFIYRNSLSDIYFYRDGGLVGSVNQANTSRTYDYINTKSISPGVSNCSELILFNADQSANRTAIETDINTYYSIY